jgi:cysteine-rich repeat protein
MRVAASRFSLLSALLVVACAGPEFGGDASATGDAPSSGSVPTSGGGTSSSAGGAGGGGGSSSDSTSSDAATNTASSGGASAGCGDWYVEPTEQCEDGNQSPGDGCSPECKLESECGNGVVEPTELCDGGPDCGVGCAPSSVSLCFGAQPLVFGANELGPGPLGNYSDFVPPTCETFTPSAVGVIELGDFPARIWARTLQNSHRVLARHGCDAPLGCARSIVTERLPAHSIVWLGSGRLNSPVSSSELEIQQIWEGFEFNDSGEGFSASGPTPSWQWSEINGGWEVSDVVAGLSVVESPAIDITGLSPVLVRIRNTFATSSPASATARIEADILGNVNTTVDLGEIAAAGLNAVTELDVVEAVGADAIRLRFLFDGTGSGNSTWAISAVLVSRSFAP